MTIRNLLEEKKVFGVETFRGKKVVKIYLDPTKEDLEELDNSFKSYEQKELRFIAHAPDEHRHYLYVWNAHEAYHQQVLNEMGIDDHWNTVQVGYGELKNNGSLILYNFDNRGKWAWLNKYGNGRPPRK